MLIRVHRLWRRLRVGGQRGLRETRQERRRRRFRVALNRAEILLDGGSRRALYWARRAYRLGPGDPNALLVLGLTWSENDRHEVALKHLEAAYRGIEVHHTVAAAELDAIVAVEAARVCAKLRLDARSQQESEAWAERVLEWAGIAARHDAASAGVLADDPLLRELGQQVWLLHASDPAYEVLA